jgi:hypothetical protein
MDEWMGVFTFAAPVLLVCVTGLAGYWMTLQHQRLDFTERLLAKGASVLPQETRHPTPV